MSVKKTGVIGVEYPTTPLLLERTVKMHNILIGNDTTQIRFAEQFLSTVHNTKIYHQEMPVVNDSHLLGKDEPQLYLVERSGLIDISPHVKTKTGIFSTDIIRKGSTGVHAIVRFAAQLLDIKKPDKIITQKIADEIVDDIYDIKASIWWAAWLLSGSAVEKNKWVRPWENWLTWMPRDEDPRYRLNSLYWELVMWVFAALGDERGYKKTKGRWNQKKFENLIQLALPKDRVYSSLEVLSIWRERQYDPYICIMKISQIWR